MLGSLLAKEFEAEIGTTEAMLALVPADKLDWQPHTKSMTLAKLAGHVAEIAGWPKFCLDTEEVDFGTQPWESPKASDGAGFVKIVADFALVALPALKATEDESFLDERWVMKYHGQVIMDFTKYEAIRHSFAQMIHHRAQLGVYLRLLDIPIPGSYGPSADSQNM
tara:strand:- start:206 stop:703 length:498 start_codon:yes stop_codon:yes gene_type:complete